MYFIDCEVYPNYFLFLAKDFKNKKIFSVEFFENESHTEKTKELFSFMNKNKTISFNGIAYDLLIISKAITSKNVKEIKKLSDEIITSGKWWWEVQKEQNITVPKTWVHLDLKKMCPKNISLKLLGARLGTETIQDLPYEPDTILSYSEIKKVKKYCENDLQITSELYKYLIPQIKLRKSLNKKHNLNFYNKSDAQIGEILIKNNCKIKQNKTDCKNFNFCKKDFSKISFNSKGLNDILEKICNHDFSVTNKKVDLPHFLRVSDIMINGRKYKMGIGGLHSIEKRQFLKKEIETYKERTAFGFDIESVISETFITDFDVASYYPATILNCVKEHDNIEHFIPFYNALVAERLHAKKIGDNTTSETLKIAINGVFGKFGDQFSILFSPKLLILTTLTGQLSLLMLIERLTEKDIDVVSANTDGIVCQYSAKNYDSVEEITKKWQEETCLTLERKEYNLIASRDVNDYFAMDEKSSVKSKGCFASSSLYKNPACSICYKAVIDEVCFGRDIEKTLRLCDDIRDFCTVRAVTGGAMYKGEKIGKTVRFYYSTEASEEDCITYVKNGNKVPLSNGSVPLPIITQDALKSVNFDRYLEICEKIKKDCGIIK